MITYVGKRVASSVLVVFLVSVFVFLMMHLLPGDPVRSALGANASEADVQRVREEMHLNDPLVSQYGSWISGIFHGDFGTSLVKNREVKDMISEAMPKTLAIGIPAIVLSSVVGILCGVASALHRGKAADQIITFVTTLGVGTPTFWIGIFLIYIFAVGLKILPMQGYVAPSQNFAQYVRHAVLPVLCLALPMFATVARQTRSNMLEVINQDSIRTNRACGLKERSVIFKHALRNAMIPVVTTIGMQVMGVFGGSVLMEQVFNIPGIGSMLTSAINNRDYWVVESGVLMIAVITVICNLLTDIVYGIVDPRIRQTRK